MAASYSSITPEQAELIRGAPLFFVATADPHFARGPHCIGPINLSPKGGTRLYVLEPNRVAFLDRRGSGNETARHVLAGSPITVMICCFEERDAAIVRLYGRARIAPLSDSPLTDRLVRENALPNWPDRCIVDIAVECASTSCGYGVPVMAFVRQRRVQDRGRSYKSR